MPKRRPVALNYNGFRILLETIASYCGVHVSSEGHTSKRHGIRFYLRTGETVEQDGSDEISRDKVLDFLDAYFKPTYFPANKCQVCVYREDNRENECFNKHKCRAYTGLTGFVRKEDKTNANVSSEIRDREVTDG